MRYLYAVTEAGNEVLPAQGLGDGPLRLVEHAGLGVVVSDDTSLTVEPTPEALWRHEAVVEELMARRTVLPMRFGTTLPDDDAVRRLLAERHTEFFAGLERVRGRVELGVRVVWAEAEAAPAVEDRPSSGRDYLLARLGPRRRAEALADAVHAPLARRAYASRRRLLATPRLLLSSVYLVEGGQIDAFARAAEELDAEHTGLSVLCTGPWPPYNFTEP